jgi:uncharacterized protein YggU (UPF0235/DUF167 family)
MPRAEHFVRVGSCDRSVRILVRVYPGAPADKVGGRYGDSEPPVLIVRVAARAVDGKANAATVRALADALGVPRGLVRIVTGQRARTKVVEVESAKPDVVAALLRQE